MIGIIGGTGLNQISAASGAAAPADTPYGMTSGALQTGSVAGRDLVFLARHGQPHRLAPHKINYQANIWALREAGVTHIIGVNAVGGIAAAMAPEHVVVPHDVIDYSYGREMTYSDETKLLHAEFGEPYDAALRRGLLLAGAEVELAGLHDGGVYACTQGPRLESAAEVDRLARDGCDVVGMTGMPEAALARELELPYASLCLVVNPAAGRGEGAISMAQINAVIESGMVGVEALLERFVATSAL